MQFPRNIYQVWFQGCARMTEPAFKQNSKSWKVLNPSWKYYCLDDSDLRKACATYSVGCAEAYDMLSMMHIKIDLGRYVTIYNWGGIYADMDAYALRPLDYSQNVRDMIHKYETGQCRHILGLSRLDVNMIESYMLTQNNITINNAIMMSSPRNPVLRQFIDHVISNIHMTKRNSMAFARIHRTTGPLAFNRFFAPVITYGSSQSCVTVFESEVFEPCQGGICKVGKNTISLHNFEMSWMPPNIKHAIILYYNYKHTILVTVMFLILLYIVLFHKSK